MSGLVSAQYDSDPTDVFTDEDSQLPVIEELDLPVLPEEENKLPLMSKKVPIRGDNHRNFVVIMDLPDGKTRGEYGANGASVAISKAAREHIGRMPLRSEVRAWVKSKHRVYEHVLSRDYDNPKRVSFKNRRARSFKLVDPVMDGVPDFSSVTNTTNLL